MNSKSSLEKTMDALDAQGMPYVLATVVRTVAATAAKAGAKAIILQDGRIADGWIGGGCAKGAVLKASMEAFYDGQPRLISVQPEDLLAELGVEPGTERDGVRFARNMCPSKGTMDIFVEPVMPQPELCILGASPVALALAALGGSFGYRTALHAPAADRPAQARADTVSDGFLLSTDANGERHIVIATQGKGDEVALRAALATSAERVAFVGSKSKAASLRGKLADSGIAASELDRIKAPAGLDIGAITPEEIALSILAELTLWRRKERRELNCELK